MFKERVVEKTLRYGPSVVSVFKELCGRGYSSPLTASMTAQKTAVVTDPSYPSYKGDKDLLVEPHSVRMLKFALTYFSKIYEVCNTLPKGENKDTADSLLLSLWAYMAGAIIGYKKDRLIYRGRLQFVQYVEPSSAD